MRQNIVLRVNEIFPTIQGEAHWTGTPATFIRLQGCAVACSWCDTKHTWPSTEKRRISIPEMMAKKDPAPTWAEMTSREIAEAVAPMTPRHFVVTGGEPCEQPLFDLTRELAAFGRVQIETSGTREINVWPETWVTVSPKVGMAGGLEPLGPSLQRADEIKMPVADESDIRVIDNLISWGFVRGEVWLQPVSCEHEATRLCIETAMDRNWKVSIQTHKFAGIR